MSRDSNVWFEDGGLDCLEVRSDNGEIAIWQTKNGNIASVHMSPARARELANFILAIT